MRSRVVLAPTARFIGWEGMQFGQRQALASYDHDWDAASVSVLQSIEIAGQCDWQESARYTDETVSKLFSVQGTAGYPGHRLHHRLILGQHQWHYKDQAPKEPGCQPKKTS